MEFYQNHSIPTRNEWIGDSIEITKSGKLKFITYFRGEDVRFEKEDSQQEVII
jgi:NOL1/NOP2/fmu family ribosome biogenesis protein